MPPNHDHGTMKQLCLCVHSVKSRTLLSADDRDGPISDPATSCSYHRALLSWLTKSFAPPPEHRQSALAPFDVPVPHLDKVTEAYASSMKKSVADEIEKPHNETASVNQSVEEALSVEEHDKRWLPSAELVPMTRSIELTKLNVTYAASHFTSVLE